MCPSWTARPSKQRCHRPGRCAGPPAGHRDFAQRRPWATPPAFFCVAPNRASRRCISMVCALTRSPPAARSGSIHSAVADRPHRSAARPGRAVYGSDAMGGVIQIFHHPRAKARRKALCGRGRRQPGHHASSRPVSAAPGHAWTTRWACARRSATGFNAKPHRWHRTLTATATAAPRAMPALGLQLNARAPPGRHADGQRHGQRGYDSGLAQG
jgi:hypothetical protein